MHLKLFSPQSAILIASLLPMPAQAVVAPITADAHTSNINAGAANTVNITPTTKGFLRFNFSTLPSGMTSTDIAKATLVFYVKSVTTSGKLQVSPITGTWNEDTVKTNNVPSIGLPLATSATIKRDKTYYAVDVTNLIMSWVDTPASNKGLALDPPAFSPTTSLTIDSKESTLTSHPAYIDIVLKGSIGSTSLQGPKGDKGDTGATGAIGPQGLKGDTGATGEQGFKGDKGDIGATGATGPQGLKGDKGDTGVTGAIGPQGLQGFQGFQGTAGINGTDGYSLLSG